MKAFTAILFCVSFAYSHTIITTFDVPYGYITGLATDDNLVWAIDSITDSVYGFDGWAGTMEEFFSVVGTGSPVGLAYVDSMLYYAESGTAILHAMNTNGSYIGSWDLSGLEVQSITGLGWEHADDRNDTGLLIGDIGSHIIWKAHPIGSFTEADTLIVLPDTLNFHDISGGFYSEGGCWIACESSNPYYRMQYWTEWGFFGTAYYDFSSTCGVAQYMPYFWDHIWVSVPSELKVYLDWYGMGVEDDTNAMTDTDLQCSENPFSNCVNITLEGLSEGACIRIIDVTGRTILESPFDGSFTWNGESANGIYLSSGCYFATVIQENGEVGSIRLVLLR
jgi:hypothetical protein